MCLQEEEKNRLPCRKIGKRLDRHFTKQTIQMASKHMKKVISLSSNQEGLVKIMMEFYCFPTRMAKSKKMDNTK